MNGEPPGRGPARRPPGVMRCPRCGAALGRIDRGALLVGGHAVHQKTMLRCPRCGALRVYHPRKIP